jgi:hypothetical protein
MECLGDRGRADGLERIPAPAQSAARPDYMNAFWKSVVQMSVVPL